MEEDVVRSVVVYAAERAGGRGGGDLPVVDLLVAPIEGEAGREGRGRDRVRRIKHFLKKCDQKIKDRDPNKSPERL